MPTSTNHTIEGQKFFPLFAWGILLMFSGFVYLLTTQLQKEADSFALTAIASDNIDTYVERTTVTD